MPTTAVFQVISDGQRADLVEVDLGVEADAALVRAARAVVLDAVAGEDVDLAVAEPDRDLDLDLAVGGAQDLPHVVGQPEALGGDVEVVLDDLVVGDLRPRWRFGPSSVCLADLSGSP